MRFAQVVWVVPGPLLFRACLPKHTRKEWAIKGGGLFSVAPHAGEEEEPLAKAKRGRVWGRVGTVGRVGRTANRLSLRFTMMSRMGFEGEASESRRVGNKRLTPESFYAPPGGGGRDMCFCFFSKPFSRLHEILPSLMVVFKQQLWTNALNIL